LTASQESLLVRHWIIPAAVPDTFAQNSARYSGQPAAHRLDFLTFLTL